MVSQLARRLYRNGRIGGRMKKVNWTAVVIFSVVVLVVFMVGVSLLGGWGYGGWSMMGPGMMGGWGFGPFGWLGMISMLLIPVGLLVLIVLGAVWLIRAIGGGTSRASEMRSCPNCGRGVQPDWRNCPYCGKSLDHA
jgi:hypothetical protein